MRDERGISKNVKNKANHKIGGMATSGGFGRTYDGRDGTEIQLGAKTKPTTRWRKQVG
jgi:hypothetical protein